MKPPRFAYARPESLEETLSLLQEHGDSVKLLAGGQSLVPMLNMRLAQPGVLVDLNGVAGLDYLIEEDGWLRCGALVRQRALEDSPLAGSCPLLQVAVRHIGHPATRNRGTICGSLAHADPAAELPAAMAALEGELVVAGPGGESSIPASDFFLTYLTTALAPDQVLKEARFPVLPAGAGCAYEEFSIRHGDYGLVGVACVVLPGPGGTAARVRLALAGVSDVPYRPREVEDGLAGQRIDAALAAEAAAAVAAELQPEGDLHAGPEYRRALAREYVSRALLRAAAGAGVAGEGVRG